MVLRAGVVGGLEAMRIFIYDFTHLDGVEPVPARKALDDAARARSLAPPARWDGKMALESDDLLIVHYSDLRNSLRDISVLTDRTGPKVLRISGEVPRPKRNEDTARVELLLAPIEDDRTADPRAWEAILRYFQEGPPKPPLLAPPKRSEELALNLLMDAVQLVDGTLATTPLDHTAESVLADARAQWQALPREDREGYAALVEGLGKKIGGTHESRAKVAAASIRRQP